MISSERKKILEFVLSDLVNHMKSEEYYRVPVYIEELNPRMTEFKKRSLKGQDCIYYPDYLFVSNEQFMVDAGKNYEIVSLVSKDSLGTLRLPNNSFAKTPCTGVEVVKRIRTYPKLAKDTYVHEDYSSSIEVYPLNYSLDILIERGINSKSIKSVFEKHKKEYLSKNITKF